MFVSCVSHNDDWRVFLVTPHPSAQTAAKVLEGAHQQHGFLSITYTQAITKNVRHKLTSRPERPSRSGAAAASQRLSADPLADNSPQYLREILLTAQPFDVVVSCPLLATVAGIFQVEKKCWSYASRWFQGSFVNLENIMACIHERRLYLEQSLTQYFSHWLFKFMYFVVAGNG